MDVTRKPRIFENSRQSELQIDLSPKLRGRQRIAGKSEEVCYFSRLCVNTLRSSEDDSVAAQIRLLASRESSYQRTLPRLCDSGLELMFCPRRNTQPAGRL